ncbi:hypothetical protein ANCCEY_03952 [Ancylostoma ceylanicum]|uniref:Uncharacterized protein n=1 Tax=Ancylostoma ceylanicum TaxID=53326 RepID=A0A0D6LYS9_9BILA|nr:hypothetical protein ANCCEY_03952 [Ancylostoma ceylanicum]
MEVDERDCPVMKTVCENENLKCGSNSCDPGYGCDRETLKCIPRKDCPSITLLPKKGCTDKMVLDENGCPVPNNAHKMLNGVTAPAYAQSYHAKTTNW